MIRSTCSSSSTSVSRYCPAEFSSSSRTASSPISSSCSRVSVFLYSSMRCRMNSWYSCLRERGGRRGAGAGGRGRERGRASRWRRGASAWLDVHRDFRELQVLLEALLDRVRDGVCFLDVRIPVHRDRDLGVAHRGRATRADSVGALHAHHPLCRLLDRVGGRARWSTSTGTARARI